jgi:hypothetical protein
VNADTDTPRSAPAIFLDLRHGCTDRPSRVIATSPPHEGVVTESTSILVELARRRA